LHTPAGLREEAATTTDGIELDTIYNLTPKEVLRAVAPVTAG
jgi:hypothetical protein